MPQMVPAHSYPSDDGSATPRRSAQAIMLSVSALLTLLTKKATQVSKKATRRVSKKLRLYHNKDNGKQRSFFYYDKSGDVVEPGKLPGTPRSPFTQRPKEFLTTVSNKAIRFVHSRKKGKPGAKVDDEDDQDFGIGGVWQRNILMGDKCQPLDYSGVIYYDQNGKKLDQVPVRSPRASPMPGYLARRPGNY